MGPTIIIDYTQEDFSQNGRRYDLIFDTAGNRSVATYQQALRPTGPFVTTAFSPGLDLPGIMAGKDRAAENEPDAGQTGPAHLAFMKTLLEAGQVVPVIDRSYPLSETAEALRYLDQGHAQGKVVITAVDDHKISGIAQRLKIPANNFYLLATCALDDPGPVDVEGVLGVDLGIVNIALVD